MHVLMMAVTMSRPPHGWQLPRLEVGVVMHAPMKASPDGLTRPPLSAKWASLWSTSSLSTPISSKMLIAGVHTCKRFKSDDISFHLICNWQSASVKWLTVLHRHATTLSKPCCTW